MANPKSKRPKRRQETPPGRSTLWIGIANLVMTAVRILIDIHKS